jgi:hypothetical protein
VGVVAYVDYVYVYPSSASIRRVKVARRELPARCVLVAVQTDVVDGVEVTVNVYVAQSPTPLSLVSPPASTVRRVARPRWLSRSTHRDAG